MKKGKILVLGLIALLMAGGLVLAGCEVSCNNCEVTVEDAYVGSTMKTARGSSCSESSCLANEASKNPQKSGYGTYKCNC